MLMRGITLIAMSVLAVLVLGVGYHFYMYPYGRRSCAVRCMESALSQYAADHFGRFPESPGGSYAALSLLYPKYTPSGIELAGVSGNIGATVAALRNGRSIDESLSSWVYFQGFSENDNPGLAILWESRGGLYGNGQRNLSGGHAVLLLSGYITNVPGADWEKFIKHQEQMRNAVQQERDTRADVLR